VHECELVDVLPAPLIIDEPENSIEGGPNVLNLWLVLAQLLYGPID